jgi:GntR family transcriptional regulator, negative regulator for fad regulon and positive regulator of fabA
MDWEPILKPAELAETRLIEAILTGHFAVNSSLPGERDLAAQLGVTRPTLREALQRLARDGWIDIQHGKATRVRDYWREGSMGVLATLAGRAEFQTTDFITYLLEVRALIAPTYTRQAILAASREFVQRLEGYAGLQDEAHPFALADWELHHHLTLAAENPIFRLLLNSFQDLYVATGERYFVFAECRQASRAFYADLLACARRGDGPAAEVLSQRVMQESLALWTKMQKQ